MADPDTLVVGLSREKLQSSNVEDRDKLPVLLTVTALGSREPEVEP